MAPSPSLNVNKTVCQCNCSLRGRMPPRSLGWETGGELPLLHQTQPSSPKKKNGRAPSLCLTRSPLCRTNPTTTSTKRSPTKHPTKFQKETGGLPSLKTRTRRRLRDDLASVRPRVRTLFQPQEVAQQEVRKPKHNWSASICSDEIGSRVVHTRDCP